MTIYNWSLHVVRPKIKSRSLLGTNCVLKFNSPSQIDVFLSKMKNLQQHPLFTIWPPQCAMHSLIITKPFIVHAVLVCYRKTYYVQFLNFTCFIVLTSSLNAPKEGDTWGINYMSFDLAEDKTRGHVINCKAFVVYTSTLFFSKKFIHPNSFFSSSWWCWKIMIYICTTIWCFKCRFWLFSSRLQTADCNFFTKFQNTSRA